MKVIALEEHIATPEVLAAWQALDPRWQDAGLKHSSEGAIKDALLDVGARRLAAMDDSGVDVQVLSMTTPGVQSLSPANAVALQQQVNDLLIETVRSQPDRYQAFATLATPDPKAAVKELERVIRQPGMQGAMLYGRTRERNMDHSDFWPIYEAASALGVPLYIHPQSPMMEVRAASYDGLAPPEVSTVLAMAGIGWHYETGLQIIRLMVAGVLDRFPQLQLILGHWGEVILFYLERISLMQGLANLPRSIPEYVQQQVLITPGGIFSQRYLRWAIEVVGIDRVLFAADYPYAPSSNGAARRFLEQAELDDADRHKIAHENWERVVAGIRR